MGKKYPKINFDRIIICCYASKYQEHLNGMVLARYAVVFEAMKPVRHRSSGRRKPNRKMANFNLIQIDPCYT